MKKLIILMLLCVLTGCTKESTMVFEAKIESLSEKSMIVNTEDSVGFDKASVGLGMAKIEVVEGDYQKISAEEAKEMMKEDKDYVILDVRTLNEYNEGHIEGAVLLPDYEIQNQAEIVLDNKENVILVYCRSGKRSEAAAKELIEMGYTHVYDLGGIMDWPYEIVKEI